MGTLASATAAHTRRRGGRPREPRIVSLAAHPRPYVSVAVAAEYLQLHEQTVRARIECGLLDVIRDGRVCRIPLASLMAYERRILDDVSRGCRYT